MRVRLDWIVGRACKGIENTGGEMGVRCRVGIGCRGRARA